LDPDSYIVENILKLLH